MTDFDRVHYEWAAGVEKPQNERPRDFEDYQEAARLVLEFSEETTKLRAALSFYANSDNWVDTSPWHGDPESITEKAIPMSNYEDGGRFCDCGDVAREALK